MTVGKFTVFDAENTSGTGCTGISLTGPFNSGNPGYSYSAAGDNGSATGFTAATANTTSVFAADESVDQLQAFADDGSSFLTGILGDNDSLTTALPSGLTPCADVGGVSGS